MLATMLLLFEQWIARVLKLHLAAPCITSAGTLGITLSGCVYGGPNEVSILRIADVPTAITTGLALGLS
jgi:hypothetical protein